MSDLPTTDKPVDDRSLVRLTGQAAVALRGTLGEPAKKKILARRVTETTEETYRIVVTPEQRKALQDGAQRWANAGKGDASLRLRDAATGRPKPEASLERVTDSSHVAKPSMTKVLGPVAWEAMAMATQQHYLVEINEKLEGISARLDEVLARGDDDKLGTLSHVAKTVADSEARLADHGSLSPARIEELHEGARDTAEVWHQLVTRFRRHFQGHRDGTTSREDLQRSWTLLLGATRVLAQASSLLTALPFATVEELKNMAFEQRERVMDAVQTVQQLAVELAAWNIELHDQWWDWLEYCEKHNPVARRVRRVARRASPARPVAERLDKAMEKQIEQFALPASDPAALIITTHLNGDVTVMAEPVLVRAR